MHPVVRKIMTDAGASDEDMAVMDGLAKTLIAETQDALSSAISCMPVALQGAAGVYFARAIEAAMIQEYSRWKTSDAPEG